MKLSEIRTYTDTGASYEHAPNSEAFHRDTLSQTVIIAPSKITLDNIRGGAHFSMIFLSFNLAYRAFDKSIIEIWITR